MITSIKFNIMLCINVLYTKYLFILITFYITYQIKKKYIFLTLMKFYVIFKFYITILKLFIIVYNIEFNINFPEYIVIHACCTRTFNLIEKFQFDLHRQYT